jgi:hypothetical protein
VPAADIGSTDERRDTVIARLAVTARFARRNMLGHRDDLHLLDSDQIYLFSTAIGALENMLRAFAGPETKE